MFCTGAQIKKEAEKKIKLNADLENRLNLNMVMRAIGNRILAESKGRVFDTLLCEWEKGRVRHWSW